MSKFKEWEKTKNIFIQFEAESETKGKWFVSNKGFKKLACTRFPKIEIKSKLTQEKSQCNLLTREVLNQYIVDNQQ
jgi:hypothetical protein